MYQISTSVDKPTLDKLVDIAGSKAQTVREFLREIITLYLEEHDAPTHEKGGKKGRAKK